jgi:hypothetical protein
VPGLAGRRGLPWRCHPHHDCSHQDPHPNSLTDHHFPRYREARRRVILIRARRPQPVCLKWIDRHRRAKTGIQPALTQHAKTSTKSHTHIGN